MRFIQTIFMIGLLIGTAPVTRADCNAEMHLLHFYSFDYEDGSTFQNIFEKHFGSVIEAEIPYHADANARITAVEIPKGGILVYSEKDLEHLPNGMYSGVIDSHGRNMFVPRAAILDEKEIAANGGHYLGTHRSAVAELKEIDHHPELPLIIIAAYDFEVSNGHINNLSPRSGSFRGGRKNWAFLIDYARHFKMIEPNTILTEIPVDGSDVFSAHIEAAEDASNRILVFNHSELKKLNETSNLLRRKIAELYPNATVDSKFRGGPGKINVDEVCEDLKASKAFPGRENLNDRLIAEVTLSRWYTKGEGAEFALADVYRKEGMEGARRHLQIMSRTYDGLQKFRAAQLSK